MKSTNKNNKAFTLIELLAVIIILGILMIIAIPAVTRYINGSKKSAYVNIVKNLMSGARNQVNEGKLEMYDTDVTYYISNACISTENESKSPYGEFDPSYVVVTYTGVNYEYYWTGRDTTGQGIKSVTHYDVIDEDTIESDIEESEIRTDLGIDGRRYSIVIDNSSSCEKGPKNSVIGNIAGKESNPIPVCIRAKTLHTTTCEYNSTTDGCGKEIGYGNTITYGNLGESRDIIPGDAFDCDVNGDGIYDGTLERFYYVSSCYNGETNTFNSNCATLIYYTNVENGIPTIKTNFAYATKDDINTLGNSVGSADNWHGPASAYLQLPSTSQWRNEALILPYERTITNENGGTTTGNGSKTIQSFTYTNKAARLLTYQEIENACGSKDYSVSGALDNCNWLFENVKKYETNVNNAGTQGYWLETPKKDNNNGYHIGSFMRNIGNMDPGQATSRGVRPAIQVPREYISSSNTVRSIEVTFDADGGVFANNETTNVISYQPKTKNIISGEYKAPSKAGKYFIGWKSVLSDEMYYEDDFTLNDKLVPTTVKAVYTDASSAICIRAMDESKLHTETCKYTNNNDYCSGAGYTANGSKHTTTITYGNLGTSGVLTTGDAFDCDVNGDGVYNSNTERFYYVSDYYDTVNRKFDNSYAVLIYYTNYKSGAPSTAATKYDSSNENWHGPTTALAELPTTSNWKSVSLKNTKRAILAEYKEISNSTTTAGGMLPAEFDYTGKAARLLNAQELIKGCKIGSFGIDINGSLDNCNFLFENTKYSESSRATYGAVIENPNASNNNGVWNMGGDKRRITTAAASSNNIGLRPVIEVPKVQISLDAAPVPAKLTFDANGGTFGSSAINVINYYPGSRTIISGEYKEATRSGYYFDGWLSSADNKVYHDTTELVVSEDTTMVAQWIDHPAVICKRVTDSTKLHTEQCSRANKFCAVAVGNGNTITYGRAKNLGTTLEAGDAFNCDLNADEEFDDTTERFYYVSKYFDTTTFEFDSNYGVFVYYSYYRSETGPVTTGLAYHTGNLNYEGPVNLINTLPKTSEWSTIRLKTTERQILAESGTTHNSLVTGNKNLPLYSYQGKAARLLTIQELMRGCNIPQLNNGNDGSLDICYFIFENTNYANDSYPTYGPWLETANYGTTNSMWRANSENRGLLGSSANATNKGIKPTIDVPLINVSY